MLSLTLAIAAATPPALTDALDTRAPAGTRVELVEWSAPVCKGTRFDVQPIERSGRVAVRVVGKACSVWGWATVRVLATQAVLTRELEAGAAIEGAFKLEEREWSPGFGSAPELEGAVASRRLRMGTALREADLRHGPPPGTQVTVRVIVNAISIEQRGTITSCGRGVCASLPSGKRITGVWSNGVLLARAEGGT